MRHDEGLRRKGSRKRALGIFIIFFKSEFTVQKDRDSQSYKGAQSPQATNRRLTDCWAHRCVLVGSGSIVNKFESVANV